MGKILVKYWRISNTKLLKAMCSVLLVFASHTGPLFAAEVPIGSMGELYAQVDSDSINWTLYEDVSETDDSDLFGIRGGYFHPHITFGLEYTDNLFNVFSDIPTAQDGQSSQESGQLQPLYAQEVKDLADTSNFLTRISPGLRISLPRSKHAPIVIYTTNTTPGGLRYQVNDVERAGNYVVHGLGNLDFKKYSADSRLDETDALVEGLFRYNFNNGLSLQVLDHFVHGQDQLEIGTIIRNDLRRFNSNLSTFTADYNATEKLRFKAEYSNFLLQYDNEINDIFNRTDNVVDLSAYYNYSLKTSLFFNWRFMDVIYETAEEKNNTQNYLFGGIRWATTEKLALRAQVGNQIRNYDEQETAETFDSTNLALEFEALYRWTAKTDFTLRMHSRSEESNSALAIDTQVFGAFFWYNQRFTEKLSGDLNFLIEKSNYNQIDDSNRDDTRFLFKPSLRYRYRDWGSIELAYQYDKRESSQNLFDYTSNTVIFNLKFAL